MRTAIGFRTVAAVLAGALVAVTAPSVTAPSVTASAVAAPVGEVTAFDPND